MFLRVHVETLDLRELERWFAEVFDHFRGHLSCLREPIVLQTSFVHGESELFVIWVLPLEVLDNLQVLGEEGFALCHTGARPLKSVQKIVINDSARLDLI